MILHVVIGGKVKLRSAIFFKEYSNTAKIVSVQRAVQIDRIYILRAYFTRTTV
jgi:hypothetical protein